MLIPGGPGDSHDYFKPYFKKLENRFRIIYFDARGRGSSVCRDTVFSIEQDVRDIAGLLRFLKIDSAHIFGHSYGGLVAAQMAIVHPELTRRVILCNTFHSAEGWQNNIDNCNRHILESFPDQWNKLMVMRKTMKSSSAEWRILYDPCITTLYWHDMSKQNVFLKTIGSITAPEFAYTVYHSVIGDDPDFSVGGTLKGLDLRPGLKALKKTVLVVTGRSDKIATVKQAVEIQQLIPNSQIRIFHQSGHMPFVEEHEAFCEAVADFLSAG